MTSNEPVVIVDAIRSAVGRRNGGFLLTHPNDMLAAVLKSLMDRTRINPYEIGQVVGGCVMQVGAQASNITRNGWLTAGLPLEIPATTVNVQCGSAQQAHTLAQGLVGSGLVDIAIACGVENMSMVPMGSTIPRDPNVGSPRTGTYADLYEPTTQMEGSDRIAVKWGLSREDLDAFAVRSHSLAKQAWVEERYATQVVPIEAVGRDADGNASGKISIERDEGMRDTTMEGLAQLRTNRQGADALHTAGTSSQISDGASALMLMRESTASNYGLTPRARVVDSVLVGSDPVLMLTGPIPATKRLLQRTGLKLDDIDVFEVNEAFASVVLAWQKELGVNPDRVNPNGGAIALGHPLGATGGILLTKALCELERTGGKYGLVSMCCGGGLGTGTIIERI